ncbi:MAG: M48 family metalloprotease [Ferruginibacter sp.]
MLKQIFSYCLLYLLCTTAAAQPVYNYIPIKDDSLKLLAAKKLITQQYEKDSAGIQDENKKYIVAIYRDRYKSIKELFDDKELISSPEADNYLSAVTSEIINKNPELKKISPRFFFSRAYWPNAFSTGEGTIVFNIDLFTKLQNESQVAFVLCHELAHLYLDHSNKKIHKYISTLYSEEMQQKLKALKKKEYDKKEELDKLELNMAFKHFRHNRDSESEADSAALGFMKNTSYDCKEALTCLALLDEIDEEKIDIEKLLTNAFSFTDYPFKKRWLQKEDAFFGGISQDDKEKAIEDSLKTHPDCKARIKLLTPAVEQLVNNGKKFLQPEQQFLNLQQLFSFEEVNYCLTGKKISRCLFNTLKLLEQNPANPYLISVTGQCLNEMYSKQKDHRLGTITDLPSPKREKKYNTLLEFIGRLSLLDISSIGYSYLKQYNTPLTGNAAYEKIFETSSKNLKDFKN